MKSFRICLMFLLVAISIAACNSGNGTNSTSNSESSVITINLKEMKHIGTVDERYQSYNVEMVEVAGGKFWKPYHNVMLPAASISFFAIVDARLKN